jgi:hypothetical protein
MPACIQLLADVYGLNLFDENDNRMPKVFGEVSGGTGPDTAIVGRGCRKRRRRLYSRRRSFDEVVDA